MDSEKKIQILNDRKKEARITLKQLEERTGLSDSTIHSVLSGKVKNPAADTLDKLAQALGVSFDQLHPAYPKIPEIPGNSDKPQKDCTCEKVRTLEQLLAKEEGKSAHAESRIADIKEQAAARSAESDKRCADHKLFILVLFVLLVGAVIFSAYEVLTVDRHVNDRGVITYTPSPSPASSATPSRETEANLHGQFGRWYLQQDWDESELYLWQRVFTALADGKDRSLEPRMKIKKPVFVAVIIGNYYHVDENCNALSDAHTIITVDEAEAIDRGFTVCGRCSGL